MRHPCLPSPLLNNHFRENLGFGEIIKLSTKGILTIARDREKSRQGAFSRLPGKLWYGGLGVERGMPMTVM